MLTIILIASAISCLSWFFLRDRLGMSVFSAIPFIGTRMRFKVTGHKKMFYVNIICKTVGFGCLIGAVELAKLIPYSIAYQDTMVTVANILAYTFLVLFIITSLTNLKVYQELFFRFRFSDTFLLLLAFAPCVGLPILSYKKSGSTKKSKQNKQQSSRFSRF